MSLSSWSSSNSSILEWNSSTEFKMCFPRDNTFLNFQATYSPRGTNGFFVAEWIALGLTCPGGLCGHHVQAHPRFARRSVDALVLGKPNSLSRRSLSNHGHWHIDTLLDVMLRDAALGDLNKLSSFSTSCGAGSPTIRVAFPMLEPMSPSFPSCSALLTTVVPWS